MGVGQTMPFIVTDACIRCKFTDCVAVCPVNCFYEGESMLVISQAECIDCGICVPECPVEAIVPDSEPGKEMWVEMNEKYSTIWPNIDNSRKHDPSAEQYRGLSGKYEKYFTPEPASD